MVKFLIAWAVFLAFVYGIMALEAFAYGKRHRRFFINFFKSLTEEE
ncbi:MAG: hypothetical protein LUC86_04315 [Prevotellaceae bacterium]|nr:hypothetical protein [Prevotellaceae bacterium]MCD8304034.1 hypothetical protein [Prevotellaceae bacterium]